MSNHYYCSVNDHDRFTYEILKNFIERTKNLCLYDPQINKQPTIIFTGSNFANINLPPHVINAAHIIVVSSDRNYVKALFNNEIADFIYKPDLNYDRFLKAIDLIENRATLLPQV